MSVKIAEASVLLVLDRSQFDAEMASLREEIAQIAGGRVSGSSGGGSSGGGGASGGGGGGGGFLGGLAGGAVGGAGVAGLAQRYNSGGGNRIRRSTFSQPGQRSSMQSFRRAISDAANDAKENGLQVGRGLAQGVKDSTAEISKEARNAVSSAFSAAEKEADISSPSARAARDIGQPIAEGMAIGIRSGAPGMAGAVSGAAGNALSVGGGDFGGLGGGLGFPIMAQVEMATHFGTAAMMANMWDAAKFTFWNWGMGLLGNVTGALGIGGFGGMAGLNVIPGDRPLSVLGLGLRNIFQNQFDAGMTQNAGIFFPGFLGGVDRFGVMSRQILGQLPPDIKNFGFELLSGALESILPGFAAGPAADLIGTLLGLKPIITKEAALAPGVFAATGTGFGSDSAFEDYPFRGGFVMTNNFQGEGPEDINSIIANDILRTMRRLGIY